MSIALRGALRQVESVAQEAPRGAPASSSHRRRGDLADPASSPFWLAELSRQLDAAVLGISPYLPYALMNLRRHIEAVRHGYLEDLDALDPRFGAVARSVDATLVDAGFRVDALEATLLDEPWPEPIATPTVGTARRDLRAVAASLRHAAAVVLDAVLEHHWHDLGDGD